MCIRDSIARMESLVGQSNYYIRGIAILNSRYPLCWLLTVLVMAVFTIPAYLKNFISPDLAFYRKKKEIEVNLVQSAYQSFRDRYASLFQSAYGIEVAFTEQYTDAPFNLIPVSYTHLR